MKGQMVKIAIAAALVVMAAAVPAPGVAATTDPGDEWILTALSFVMERDGRLSPGRVSASCHNGVVALHGTVLTEEERGLAEQLTMLIPGVRGIVNDLSVAPAVDGNARVAQDVRSLLIEDPSVQIKGLNVRARDGVVTLSGAVDDRNQERFADRLAMAAPQVVRVEDRLRILRPA